MRKYILLFVFAVFLTLSFSIISYAEKPIEKTNVNYVRHYFVQDDFVSLVIDSDVIGQKPKFLRIKSEKSKIDLTFKLDEKDIVERLNGGVATISRYVKKYNTQFVVKVKLDKKLPFDRYEISLDDRVYTFMNHFKPEVIVPVSPEPPTPLPTYSVVPLPTP